MAAAAPTTTAAPPPPAGAGAAERSEEACDGADVVIKNSVLMGADFYETSAELADDATEGRPPLGIGAGSRIDCGDFEAVLDRTLAMADWAGFEDRAREARALGRRDYLAGR